jgi:hypothetical protein
MKTKGEIEAAICEGISRFEQGFPVTARRPNALTADPDLDTRTVGGLGGIPRLE